jgi:hypothetical protein
MSAREDSTHIRKPFPPGLIGALLGWTNLFVLLLAIAQAAPTLPGDDSQPDYDGLLVLGIVPATFFGWVLGVAAGLLVEAPPAVRRFALLCLGMGAWFLCAPGGTAAELAFPSWVPTIVGVLLLERLTRAPTHDVLPLARLR